MKCNASFILIKRIDNKFVPGKFIQKQHALQEASSEEYLSYRNCQFVLLERFKIQY